jgi:hypothetical protein
MTTNIDQLQNAAQKAADALAEAQAKLAAEQAAMGDTIEQAQRAWREATHKAGRDRDDTLAAQEKDHYEAAVTAAEAGDLSTAYAEYVAYRQARTARRMVRTEAQSAAQFLGKEPYTRGDLSMIAITFQELIDTAADKASSFGGADLAHETTGTIPTDHAEALAYLEGKEG